MSVYLKGIRSREEIIRASREVFNTEGLDLTLSSLSLKMNITLGRITHHFPNKNYLFIAIADEYQKKLGQIHKDSGDKEVDLESLINLLNRIMDLQYDYRCAIRYIVSSIQNRSEIKSHISETYNTNRLTIYESAKSLVEAGSLNEKILDPAAFEVFQFQITNLFTTWVLNFELYDSDKTYAEIKPVYIKGIISSFIPYLTSKGTNELNNNRLFSS